MALNLMLFMQTFIKSKPTSAPSYTALQLLFMVRHQANNSRQHEQYKKYLTLFPSFMTKLPYFFQKEKLLCKLHDA